MNPPIYFRRNLENMIVIANEHDIAIMLATRAFTKSEWLRLQDYYQQGFQGNNNKVKEVATGHDVPLFDFAEVMPQDPTYWADRRHVNEAGALVNARLFA